mgnify:CR=1 FL=1
MLQHIERPQHIDLRIEHRIFDRTPHVHLSGEVEHDRRPFVAKNPFELGIFYIQFVELGRLGDVFPLSRDKIIDHHNIMPLLEQTIHDM